MAVERGGHGERIREIAIHKEVVDPWRGAGLYPHGAEPTSEAEKVKREA